MAGTDRTPPAGAARHAATARQARWGRRLGAAILVAASGLATGCSGDDEMADNPVAEAAQEQGDANRAPDGGFFASPERVPELIRQHLGESPEIRRLWISADSFSVEVRDPVKRDNLDDYGYYEGAWTTRPISVTLREIEEYESVTFRMSSITWDAIPGLIEQALAGLDLEGEEIGAVSYDRLAGETPRVFISVNGLRGSGSLLANADGTDVEIRRN